MSSRANLIARTVLNQFDKLPAKRKPGIRDNGLHEWVPLSGIVAERNGTLTCLALATGMKCLPSTKITESNGVGIHDWHAEVLAMRTFNRYILDECREFAGANASGHDVIERKRDPNSGVDSETIARPFQIHDDVKLHMYCSEAPCGDASMELTMAAQEDATPWETTTLPPSEPTSGSEANLLGRANFSQLGIVRRKPGRGDAPPTLSKSCSDKLALKQCTSLLSALTSLLVDPANVYIDSLILPASQYSAKACERAFSASGRMKPASGMRWRDGYSFKPFSVETTTLEFDYSKRAVQARADKIVGANLAAAWSLSGFEETIIGGVIQGRKPFDNKGASRMSRQQMWTVARDVAGKLEDFCHTLRYLSSGTYQDVKDGSLLAGRREVKDDARRSALSGWAQNTGGSSFKIDHTA